MAIEDVLDTPLLSRHRSAGAQFTEFGGWRMPLRYTSDLAEHRAVRERAGLFDLTHMGEVLISGRDAPAWLDHTLAGRSSDMSLGRARYNLLVNEAGGILDDLIVYRLAERTYLLIVNAANRLDDVTVLLQRQNGCEVEIEDVSASNALIAIQGPLAESILAPLVEWRGTSGFGVLFPVANACGEVSVPVEDEPSLAETGYYRIGSGEIRTGTGSVSVLIARTGYTGEDGFEILVPAADAVPVWDALLTAGGSELQRCGLAARDTLRLEAGMPLYGHELTTETTPYDAGLGRVVKLDKPEGMVGQEALEAAHAAEGTRPKLVGLSLEGRRAARAGTQLLSQDGNVIGRVTSGVLSPTLGHPVAMGYADPAFSIGDQVQADVRGTLLPAVLTEVPFYHRPR
ncbi:MAG: glycine cleavage system protein T [Microbacteriaceae bacterium]|jgi:aminomethyltransferase|nr:glycine cleavage system protein T [Microbacteriaceae bacterium]MCI1207630.1 glycine cleavage system protein T [Microbacteriaceae bacterium]